MKLSDVNTTDIVDAIRLGCRAMSNAFDADDNDVPFFDVVVRPEARMDFSPHLSEAHVPGRHLNALLNAEDAASIAIDEDAVEKHERAAFLSYGGPVALPLNRTERGGPLVNFLAHNVREGFHPYTPWSSTAARRWLASLPRPALPPSPTFGNPSASGMASG